MSFQATLWLSLAVDHFCQSTSTVHESNSVGWKLYILSFHQVLSAPTKSTGMIQVGVALFPPFKLFYHFTFPRSPFKLMRSRKKMCKSGWKQIIVMWDHDAVVHYGERYFDLFCCQPKGLAKQVLSHKAWAPHSMWSWCGCTCRPGQFR
jgi:hypothetical protein